VSDGAVVGIDHVQVAAPAGCESQARAFYGDALGLPELAKPEALAGRGGCWFACGDRQLHVGVAEPFAPATKAHPALLVRDAAALAGLLARLAAAGHPPRRDVPLPGLERAFVDDPFGNRVELVAPTS
jgi:catechol 2,3-dioxygenase-like lactoylglutathione lyase family enzyme